MQEESTQSTGRIERASLAAQLPISSVEDYSISWVGTTWFPRLGATLAERLPLRPPGAGVPSMMPISDPTEPSRFTGQLAPALTATVATCSHDGKGLGSRSLTTERCEEL